MPKFSIDKHRILQQRVTICMFAALGLIAIIKFIVLFGKYSYTHIPEEAIPTELYRETTPYLIKKTTRCQYDEILKSTKSIESWDIPMNNNDFSPTGITNGSYVPGCHPAFSVAILKQLDIFLPYMHNFLRKQNIHYKHAIVDKFPCLILHDVDILPLDLGNLYVCTKQPRHMSASIDKFRYVLPY
ncbi:Beta-1,4-galactosyltransferase [Operophtera brumata]|uniref:Beta-1,4-galactosyltransferase n=1 Tax=Operophtera brumata TaxID=104452 RepID=A0A0L7KWZ9_OPEBR|nr:Beta-1,4-galactosyltransferase [Operophtera brumata]